MWKKSYFRFPFDTYPQCPELANLSVTGEQIIGCLGLGWEWWLSSKGSWNAGLWDWLLIPVNLLEFSGLHISIKLAVCFLSRIKSYLHSCWMICVFPGNNNQLRDSVLFTQWSKEPTTSPILQLWWAHEGVTDPSARPQEGD